ncbi:MULTISPECIES: hypothetical protein [unclassified Dolichospermum]|jgi:hypothetical protein|uniref:hypothetical protein n=1 Tax=unclassified Dolichospermum TaxID=2622029 RepID=UPI001445B835|nr:MULTISPECIES: hypothetical protein [unclassified Dolichospermum]MTJ16755.1 hypothetical protein [Dolichospermum sp. UHCC 0299]MTJ37577.1 hypothetical protein [Dolichospermum sp. UHCC 0406]
MNAQAKNLQTLYAKTRLLLALWDLGGSQQKVARGKLTKRIDSKSQNKADYQAILEDLEAQGAVTVTKKGSSTSYTLTSPTGLDVLKAGLRSDEFEFNTNLGAWVGNSLLRLFREIDVVVAAPVASGGAVIGSYEEFKSVALDIYDKLNYEHNLNNLVPIYRIRREIGERVNRTEFNDFLLEMQADDIFQLQGGSVEDSAPDKIEDSIKTALDGLRCYAKRI